MFPDHITISRGQEDFAGFVGSPESVDDFLQTITAIGDLLPTRVDTCACTVVKEAIAVERRLIAPCATSRVLPFDDGQQILIRLGDRPVQVLAQECPETV